MRAQLFTAAALALALLFPTSVLAAASAEAEETPVGELHVTTDAEYVKVEVNGQEWTSTEFEANGKRVLIKGLQLDTDNAVTLTPRTDALAPVDLTVAPKEFKRVRKGKVFFLIAKKAVKFPKATDKRPEPEPERKPEPETKPERDDKPAPDEL